MQYLWYEQYNHIKARERKKERERERERERGREREREGMSERVNERQSQGHCKTAILVKEANDNKRTSEEEAGGQGRRSISMIDTGCLAKPSPP